MGGTWAKTKAEYVQLWSTCQLRSDKLKQIDSVVGQMISSKARYQGVQASTGLPWFFLGVLHNLESGMNFSRHYHNGDPLTARTVQKPEGRPKTGNPPFTWEQSAADALSEKIKSPWGEAGNDYSIPALLWRSEIYNGWGYRTKKTGINSPYLWSATNHYTRGKFYADGKYSPSVVSQQIGVAAIFKRMIEKQIISDQGGDTGLIPNMGGNYGTGCIDPGIAGSRNFSGVYNPTSMGDAMAYALGLHALDRTKSHELHMIIDVAAQPDVLNLEVQQLFTLKGVAEGLDGEDWILDEIIYHLGGRLEAEIFAYKPDPNAPATQLFRGNTDPAPTPSPGSLPEGSVPAGEIGQRIMQNALANKGKETRSSGPVCEYGNLACAWAVNRYAIEPSGLKQLGQNPLLVDSLEADLKGGRGQLITPRDTAAQGGDIVIMGAGSRAHVGIYIGNGQILSNSSSKREFSWIAGFPTYDRYYGSPCRTYRMLR